MSGEDSQQGPLQCDEHDIKSTIDLINNLFQEDQNILNPQPRENVYPELLLQENSNVNRYYNYFQRNSRQFIDDTSDGKVVRWTDSSIEILTKLIIESWINGDSEHSENLKLKQESKKLAVSPPTGLFSWSSGDSYIQARRKAIQDTEYRADEIISSKNESLNDDSNTNESSNKFSNIKFTTSNKSITNQLNYVVEIEANKFIHARIQVIKAHHNEQMSRQIHERKRKDHEITLQKLKQKEEESETLLREATNEQNSKNNGFFGSLFGFGASVNNPETQVSEQLNNLKGSEGLAKKRFSFLPKGNINLWNPMGSSAKGSSDKLAEEVENGGNIIKHLRDDNEKITNSSFELDHKRDNCDKSFEEGLEENDEVNEDHSLVESEEVRDTTQGNNDDIHESVSRQIFDFDFIERPISTSASSKPELHRKDQALNFNEDLVTSLNNNNQSTSHNFISLDTYTHQIQNDKDISSELIDIFDTNHKREESSSKEHTNLLEL